jgi:hypothetical protein
MTDSNIISSPPKPKRRRRKPMGGGLPYASATSDMRAREEIRKILLRFGCESIGFMDDNMRHEVLLAFTHRGRQIQMTVSANGWAAMWLKENPYNGRRRRTRHEYEQAALAQGRIAVNSILRDWVKAQITIIESGIVSFEAVFMPFMLTNDGRTMIERVAGTSLLPSPDSPKVLHIHDAS